MDDICILYASEDRQRVEELERALKNCGWDVWWDVRLPEGDFRSQIETELSGAGCVIPVWSTHSVSKAWVREEARYALDIPKPLLPVQIEPCVIPLGQGRQAISDLKGWRGDSRDEKFRALRRRIEKVLNSSSPPWSGKRTLGLEINGKKLTLPAFFRSVSSFETQLRPDAALQALKILNVYCVLASAYDLARSEEKDGIKSALKGLHKNRSIVM